MIPNIVQPDIGVCHQWQWRGPALMCGKAMLCSAATCAAADIWAHSSGWGTTKAPTAHRSLRLASKPKPR
jgi:hypothetical protein